MTHFPPLDSKTTTHWIARSFFILALNCLFLTGPGVLLTTSAALANALSSDIPIPSTYDIEAISVKSPQLTSGSDAIFRLLAQESGNGLPVNTTDGEDTYVVNRIAFIDLGYIERGSDAFQAFLPDFRALQQRYRTEISEREEQLKRRRSETEAQRSILSPEAYSERVNELNNQTTSLRELFQQRSREVDNLLAGARDKLLDQVMQTTMVIMEDRQIDIVLNVGGVSPVIFTYAIRLRIDDDVLSALNTKDFNIRLEDLQTAERESQTSR